MCLQDEFEDFGFAGDDAEAAAASGGAAHGEESASYKTIRALFDSYDTDRSGYVLRCCLLSDLHAGD